MKPMCWRDKVREYNAPVTVLDKDFDRSVADAPVTAEELDHLTPHNHRHPNGE